MQMQQEVARLRNQISKHTLQDYQLRDLTEHMLCRHHALMDERREVILSNSEGEAGNHSQLHGRVAHQHTCP